MVKVMAQVRPMPTLAQGLPRFDQPGPPGLSLLAPLRPTRFGHPPTTTLYYALHLIIPLYLSLPVIMFVWPLPLRTPIPAPTHR